MSPVKREVIELDFKYNYVLFTPNITTQKDGSKRMQSDCIFYIYQYVFPITEQIILKFNGLKQTSFIAHLFYRS